MMSKGLYVRFLKRFLDFWLSLAALVLISPLLLAVAILVRIKLGSPVIFKQERPGKNEKIFTLYKFRSMTDQRDASGTLLPDEARLTKFGRALRSISIDELPELWNILKGDMSIIGPRPLLVEYLPYYSDAEHHRHDARPGLTGLAQINGRNALSWEKRFEYDLEYVGHISLIEDIKIFFKTIWVVLKHENIGQGEECPIPFNVVRQAQMDASKENNKEPANEYSREQN